MGDFNNQPGYLSIYPQEGTRTVPGRPRAIQSTFRSDPSLNLDRRRYGRAVLEGAWGATETNEEAKTQRRRVLLRNEGCARRLEELRQKNKKKTGGRNRFTNAISRRLQSALVTSSEPCSIGGFLAFFY